MPPARRRAAGGAARHGCVSLPVSRPRSAGGAPRAPGGGPPAEVFGAVADELGRLIGAEATFVSRVDELSGERGEIERYVTVVGSYGRVSDQAPVGFRRKLQPGMAMTAALRTGGPARLSGDMLT